MDENGITGCIKAFMKPKQMENCIISAHNAGINKFIVGYDGPDNLLDKHTDIIESFEDEIDIGFYKYEYDHGLSAVRNRIYEKVKTPYLFQLDDDNYIPSKALDIVNFLEKHDNCGAVALGWIIANGNTNIDAYEIKIDNNYCVRYNNTNKNSEIIGENTYVYPFTFIPNCAMYKTKVFNDIKFDEKFKIGREHEDFMLRAKDTKWKFAVCHNIFAIHDTDTTSEVKHIRSGRERRKSVRYFLKKWGIKGIYPSSLSVRLHDTKRELGIIESVINENSKSLMVGNIYDQ